MTDDLRVALTGATGFTGRLTARALLDRGITPVLVGRDRAKLEALARELGAAVELRVVDPLTPQTTADALADARVVVATAGPFVTAGEPALAYAARHGRRYVDCTGEQPFVRLAMTRYQATAEASGACLVPSCGFESALGDWAASLAAQALGDAELDAIEVVYATRGFGTTAGTRESALRVAAGEGVSRVEGRLVPERPASRWRSVELDGRTRRAGSFPGIEALVVARHVRVRDVRSYMVMGRRTERVAKLALPLLRRMAPLVMPFAEQLARRGGSPVETSRTGARFAVFAEARRGGDLARAEITGTDPYGLTAEILADAAVSLRSLDVASPNRLGAPRTGVVAPSEVLDAAESMARYERFGLRMTVR